MTARGCADIPQGGSRGRSFPATAGVGPTGRRHDRTGGGPGSGSRPFRRPNRFGNRAIGVVETAHDLRGAGSRATVSQDFRGEHVQKVDAKARVSIPAPFRDVLSAGDPPTAGRTRTRIVMVYGGTDRAYAECYTMAGADRLARKVRRLALGSPEREIAERDLITRSLSVEIDDEGRIVLPQKVRDKIGFGTASETVFAGHLNTFRIWRRDTYETVMGVVDDRDEDVLRGRDVLALLGEFEDDGEE